MLCEFLKQEYIVKHNIYCDCHIEPMRCCIDLKQRKYQTQDRGKRNIQEQYKVLFMCFTMSEQIIYEIQNIQTADEICQISKCSAEK